MRKSHSPAGNTGLKRIERFKGYRAPFWCGVPLTTPRGPNAPATIRTARPTTQKHPLRWLVALEVFQPAGPQSQLTARRLYVRVIRAVEELRHSLPTPSEVLRRCYTKCSNFSTLLLSVWSPFLSPMLASKREMPPMILSTRSCVSCMQGSEASESVALITSPPKPMSRRQPASAHHFFEIF